MNLETKYLNLAKEIILKYVPKEEYAVFLFGPFAIGEIERKSRIEIGFMGEEDFPIHIKSSIESEMEESIIPYYVNVYDFKNVSEEFKKTALEHIVIWNFPEQIMIK